MNKYFKNTIYPYTLYVKLTDGGWYYYYDEKHVLLEEEMGCCVYTLMRKNCLEEITRDEFYLEIEKLMMLKELRR